MGCGSHILKALEHSLSPFSVPGILSLHIRIRSKSVFSHSLGIGSSTEMTHTVLLVVQPKVFDLVQFLNADFGRGNVPERKCSASKSA